MNDLEVQIDQVESEKLARRKVSRVGTLADEDSEDDYLDWTPEQRLSIMWQLTLDAWSFTGKGDAQFRLQRDVAGVKRRRS